MNLIDRVLESPLSELAADAAALVDDLADFARTADDNDRKVEIATRSPIRIGMIRVDVSSERADLIAIVAVPGAFGGQAIRWQRRGATIEARDHFGTALKNVPDYQKLVAHGDTRTLLTTLLRTIQRPAPASVAVGDTRHVLLPETTVGRTAIADIVIADDRLAKLAWTYEWSDDAWWVRAGKGVSNITLNGVSGWDRRELEHGDVVACGDIGVRFVVAD